MAKTTVTEMPTTTEELEAMLAAREKELAEREKALAKKEKELKAAAAPAKAEPVADPKSRKVKVRLPLGADKEPVMVRVNDHTYIIKRGVEVEVPYFVGMHLQECMSADDQVRMRLDGLDDLFAAESSKV
jgi:hypothetical protein